MFCIFVIVHARVIKIKTHSLGNCTTVRVTCISTLHFVCSILDNSTGTYETVRKKEENVNGAQNREGKY